jgi:hypothetical protein
MNAAWITNVYDTHDEIASQCPKNNIRQRLVFVMIVIQHPLLSIPQHNTGQLAAAWNTMQR